jgi:hypothetical protein
MESHETTAAAAQRQASIPTTASTATADFVQRELDNEDTFAPTASPSAAPTASPSGKLRLLTCQHNNLPTFAFITLRYLCLISVHVLLLH